MFTEHTVAVPNNPKDILEGQRAQQFSGEGARRQKFWRS